ncbi:helix-turn-helix transcriptional regulator [Planotetraspora mira]|uniref:Transcriptional regulator n=1 Tax=Planotetraspora mira TaxID=58121 RepID=A0A8J3XA28_9ACTN|nr:helix-turn-helix transcriptional regulator [Planotetraspora mira]GII32946.1 transcriptional regulator [Planotetraspora mira]
MNRDKRLGEFLRARRQVTSPDQVGLMDGGRRRTPGLRRDEVAMLAGVSTEYYMRIEQGRERRPSDQVIAALARTLRLDGEATRHLCELARPRADTGPPSNGADQVSPAVLRLIEKWDHAPALVVNHRLDVVAKNRLAVALFKGLEHDNLVRFAFLDPVAHEFYMDWEQEARNDVADLRAAAGADPRDPFLNELVEELSRASEDFRHLWARHDVQSRKQGFVRLCRRDVGHVTLWHETLRIESVPGLRIFVGEAEPGSPSQAALDQLDSLVVAPNSAGLREKTL